jgi:hypothetical protein
MDGTSQPSERRSARRVLKACDWCRSRKDRCDGARPACSSCTAAARPCSYNTESKKRGLPEGLVRGLEKLWALAIRHIPEVEDAVLVLLHDGLQSGGQGDFVSMWSGDVHGDSLLSLWRNSRLFRELRQQLPVLEELPAAKRPKLSSPNRPSRPFHVPGQRSDVVLTAAESARRICRRTEPESSPVSLPVCTAASTAVQPLSRPLYEIASPEGSQSSVRRRATFQLPTQTHQLLDLYFNYTHLWFPILERHDLFRISYRYSQGPTLPGAGEQAVLCAVLAYATFQSQASTAHHEIDRAPAVWDRGSDALRRQACELIPKEHGVFDIGHVQALLLLSLINMGNGEWQEAWLTLGQASRIALLLGLAKPDGLHKRQYDYGWSRRKQIVLGCFVLETIVSTRLHLTPQLNSSNIIHVEKMEENGSDEWDPWMGATKTQNQDSTRGRCPAFSISTFNRLVEISKTLNTAICGAKDGNSEQLYGYLRNELDCWNDRQPAMFRLGLDNPSERDYRPLPHLYLLHFAHISTLMTLYSRCSVGPCSLEQEPHRQVVSLEGYIGTLLEEQTRLFDGHTISPAYEPLMQLLLDSIEHLCGPSVKDAAYSRCLRAMYDTISGISDIWAGCRPLERRLAVLLDLDISQVPRPSSKRQAEGQVGPSNIRPPTDNGHQNDKTVHRLQNCQSQAPQRRNRPSDAESAESRTAEGTSASSRNLAARSQSLTQPDMTKSVSEVAAPPVYRDQDTRKTVTWPAVTHSSLQIESSSDQFPRDPSCGESEIDSIFQDFVTADAMEW